MSLPHLPREVRASYGIQAVTEEGGLCVIHTSRALSASEEAAVSFMLGRDIRVSAPPPADDALAPAPTLPAQDRPRPSVESATVEATTDEAEPEDAASETTTPPLLASDATGDALPSPGTPSPGTSAPATRDVPLYDAPPPRAIRRILDDAVQQGASDIHIEPFESTVRVRFRVDGVLHTAGRLRIEQRDAMVARLKIMAELDIAEKRRPQDGRITLHRSGGDDLDLRVSTVPTSFGEKAVLRILDRSDVDLSLSALGFSDTHRSMVEDTLRRTHGMLLVTGPTGSGKTTTLYAALRALQRDAVNVQTIEDPVEYEIEGINQSQVRADIGFTFASALRAFLRQDPDVIMVGEIRDLETAEVAIRAALTGHLVLSTLHTNDAASAPLRLVDMGVPPYLVAATVQLVIAQRLLRTLCPTCAQPMPDADVPASVDLPAGADVHRAVGCPSCNATGYQKRTGIFECLAMDDDAARCITGDGSVHALRRWARTTGHPSLRDAAMRTVAQGRTSIDEALRRTTL